MLTRLCALAVLSLPVAAAAADQLVVDVPTLQAPPPQTAAAPKAKLVCHSDYAIGSFVRKVRWCATAAEWRESERSARTTTDRIQSDKGRYDVNGPLSDVMMQNGRVVIGGH